LFSNWHLCIDQFGCAEKLMTETLFYETAAPFFVPPGLHGFRGRVGNLDVSELRGRSKFLPYLLRMECQVATKDQLGQHHREAWLLARDLNIVWSYVALVPLFPKRFIMEVVEAPDGWHTNLKKLKMTRPIKPRPGHVPGPAASFSVSIKTTPGHLRVNLPYLPLQPALDAVQKYRTANPETRLLMDLHFGAFDQRGTSAPLFLYAKALELARYVMLPGRTDLQKEAALSPKVRAALRGSFHSLFEIANRRLEIRHVADTRSRSLLPKLSPKESADFEHDADLVIRGVVERELGIVAIAKP
jgi:hypothetical protein